MSKRIIYADPLGNVTQVIPDERDQLDGETEFVFRSRVMLNQACLLVHPKPDETEESHARRVLLHMATHPRRVVDAATLPNRRFRNLWKMGADGTITVDLASATEEHLKVARVSVLTEAAQAIRTNAAAELAALQAKLDETAAMMTVGEPTEDELAAMMKVETEYAKAKHAAESGLTEKIESAKKQLDKMDALQLATVLPESLIL